jgi:hypothetical protein
VSPIQDGLKMVSLIQFYEYLQAGVQQKVANMALIRSVWQTVRGMSLLVMLAGIFTVVLLVSCLARLMYGNGVTEVAGRLRLGS